MSMHVTQTLRFDIDEIIVAWNGRPILCASGLNSIGIEFPTDGSDFVLMVSDSPMDGGKSFYTNGFEWWKNAEDIRNKNRVGDFMSSAREELKRMFPEFRVGFGCGIVSPKTKQLWVKVG